MSNSELPHTLLSAAPADSERPNSGPEGRADGKDGESSADPSVRRENLDPVSGAGAGDESGSLRSPEETRPNPIGIGKLAVGLKSSSTTNERKFSGKCSPERLSGETSRQERRELSSAFAHVLRSKLSSNRAVYLEGLGVIFPELQEISRAYVLGGQLAVRRESILRVNFERAGELSPFIRERYASPLEIGALGPDVYKHLPLPLQLTWTPTQMRFYLSGIVALLRREIVLDGFSHRLQPFCSFFSLHNRHGESTVDWFAGADIFIHSGFEAISKVEQPKLMERARFTSVTEFGEVALGARKHTFPLSIAQALNDIGVTPSRSFYPEVGVSVFERAPGRLAFLTDGARHVPCVSGRALGAEFVIDCELDQLSAWPFTVLASLIDAVVSQPELSRHDGGDSVMGSGEGGTGAARDPSKNVGILRSPALSVIPVPASAFGQASANGGLVDNGNGLWAGALLSQSDTHEELLLESNDSLKLLWITPLFGSEYALATRRTADHAAALLKRKGVMMSARLNRASVLFRTEVL